MAAGKRDRDQREARLRRLMARQHGLIHRDQALGIGMSTSGVHRRLKSGAWIRHYRCVYGVAGAPSTFEQRALAACLAVGPSSVLSHTSAGTMWGWCNPARALHVTSPGQVTARPPGVTVHRTTTFVRGDVGRLRQVPITSPARTLLDIAGLLPEEAFDEVLQRAVVAGCVAPARLRERVASAARGCRGTATTRRLIAAAPRHSHVATPLERAVAAVLREVGPAFVREHPVYLDGGVYYLDFAWPHFRVGVEADGRRWHSDAGAFERDRDRHNALAVAGWRVLRVTERQVRIDPAALRDRVRELLVRG